MENFDLDLDTVAPQAKIIRLNGQSVQIYPPKLKVLIELNTAASKLEAGNTVEGMPEIMKVLAKIVPILAQDDVDLTVDQLLTLTAFIGKMAKPAAPQGELSTLEDDGVKKNLE